MAPPLNVGPVERAVSVLGGSALVLFALRRSPTALALAALGAGLIWRGARGHSGLYAALDIDRAPGAEVRGNLGIKIDKAVVVREKPETLYRFWRDFSNLPHVITNLESVHVIGATRSHWRLKSPAGTAIEWDAEIINDRPDDLIAWRSTPSSSVQHAGSVRFVPVDGGATRVEVSLQYAPPGGELGHILAELLGADAGEQVEEGLRNLKLSMERARIAEKASW